MRFLITGAEGQVGRALQRRAAARGLEVIAAGRSMLDITAPITLPPAIDGVINAAAYTAVDRAESEKALAYAVNRDAPAALAAACAVRELPFFHISTDYVFDGEKPTPYVEDDPINPVSVYGASKAAGEQAVRAAYAASTIVRTAWVFGLEGANFVRTMIRLARERPVLRVVADQHGCPTFADDLADALLTLAERRLTAQLLHFTGAGPTTWHAFAESIIATARPLTPIACTQIDAITTADYPTPARRPKNSVLDTSRIRALDVPVPSWRAGMQALVVSDTR